MKTFLINVRGVCASSLLFVAFWLFAIPAAVALAVFLVACVACLLVFVAGGSLGLLLALPAIAIWPGLVDAINQRCREICSVEID